MNVVEINGEYWFLLFYHISNDRLMFNSTDEARYSDNPRAYSRLALIDPRYKINGKYEFMLQYETDNIRWRQTKNPCEETEPSASYPYVEGFELLYFPEGVTNTFGGLAQTSSQEHNLINTYLKGHFTTANWWYAIGQYQWSHTDWDCDKIAGLTYFCASFVYLWMKVPQSQMYFKRYQKSLFIDMRHSLFSLCFISVMYES